VPYVARIVFLLTHYLFCTACSDEEEDPLSNGVPACFAPQTMTVANSALAKKATHNKQNLAANASLANQQYSQSGAGQRN